MHDLIKVINEKLQENGVVNLSMWTGILESDIQKAAEGKLPYCETLKIYNEVKRCGLKLIEILT